MSLAPAKHLMDNTNTITVTLFQRIVSACVGSFITSFVVTPLDVVKVRLQAQTPISIVPFLSISQFKRNGTKFSQMRNGAVINPASIMECTHYQFCNGIMDHMCLKNGCTMFEATATQKPQSKANPRFFGTWDAFVKIVRMEGFSSLWSGLPPTLVMAVPANILYFTVYDELKKVLSERYNPKKSSEYLPSWIPIVAGGGARTLATIIVSPLELLRTQMQSNKDVRMIPRLKKIVKSREGLKGLVRGLAPTLLRDVPFSSLYWFGVEKSRAMIIANRTPTNSPFEHFWISFVSGAFAGMAAAAITTPFDVIKTKMQVNLYSQAGYVYPTSTMELFSKVIKEEGWAGLTTGMGARIARVGPSCAIMISVYELGKKLFSME